MVSSVTQGPGAWHVLAGLRVSGEWSCRRETQFTQRATAAPRSGLPMCDWRRARAVAAPPCCTRGPYRRGGAHPRQRSRAKSDKHVNASSDVVAIRAGVETGSALMIDINSEQLIALRDVPRCLPTRVNGRRLHISAVYRWCQRGIGGVILESIRIGGTTYTSTEALARFAAARTPGTPPPAAPTAPRARQRAIDEVSERVRRELGLPPADGPDAANS